jgi:hypothetical protein
LFFLLIGFVFWITSLHDWPERSEVPVPEKVAHPGVDMVLGGGIRPQPSGISEMRGVSAQDIEGRTKLP